MLKGISLLLLAELCFASSTVFAKLVTNSTPISGIEVTFFRFLIGFVASYYTVMKLKIPLKPNKSNPIIWRAILNTTAVLLFFKSVQHTSITNSNMLNMTYPVFIFIVSPLFTKDRSRRIFYIFLAATMIGIYMVINPDFNHINQGDVWGLLSGIVGAFSVISLRLAREHDSTILILFYLMGIGLIINLACILPNFIMPTGINILYVAASAVLGFLGQVFITVGYKYISAREGSLVSASRIIFAVFLGVCVFSEDITLKIVVGGILILSSILGVGLVSQGIKLTEIIKFKRQ